MTNIQYREKAKRTLPDLGEKLNLCHMLLGLNSEIGELVECVGTELKGKIDRVNLIEELGDLYWYITNYCNIRELPIPEEIKIDVPNDMCLDLLIMSVGDLNNLVKRYIAYNNPIKDKAKELEVIYNIYAAIFLFESAYTLDGSVIRAKNIAKLIVRFPDKYSDEKALNRSTNNERQELEK